MTLLDRGTTPPKKQEGRDRLTVRDPLVENVLAGINFDILNIDDTRRFGNRLTANARRWWQGRLDVADGRRLHKRDADRALRFALAALPEGEAE